MSRPSTSDTAAPVVNDEDLEQVVAGTRAVASLIAQSLAALEPSVTMPQWRVLVLANSGQCNVSAVADDLGIHISNATRLCDRLVAAGLVRRTRDERDRRHVLLHLTADGRSLFDQAMAYRRRRIEQALSLMSADERAALARGMTAVAAALPRVRASQHRP